MLGFCDEIFNKLELSENIRLKLSLLRLEDVEKNIKKIEIDQKKTEEHFEITETIK